MNINWLLLSVDDLLLQAIPFLECKLVDVAVEVVLLPRHHLALPTEAETHYRAVCRALVNKHFNGNMI